MDVHPPLAKLLIAGSIKLFGDNPWGWRIGSVVFGTLALLAIFALVRSLGGSRWLATGVTAAMACDNLFDFDLSQLVERFRRTAAGILERARSNITEEGAEVYRGPEREHQDALGDVLR